jgi:mannose-6-phosphate isomerase
MKPVLLPPNVVPRFYRGGPEIAALRGIAVDGERMPEEWVGSTTTAFGEQRLGLATLPGGGLLRDAIAADPAGYLGPEHVARFGPDPALLVKLLDAGERLPVHAHPDAAFAQANLGIPFGKTEAWIVIAAAGDACAVHAGWRAGVDRATLAGWVERQDHDALLGALNPLAVKAGDAVFVPAGVPHAIGAGVLIIELQEPTDMSVLLEWEGFGIADVQEATLGLGWERALGCVELAARAGDELRGPAPAGAVASLLPAAADRFFRAERVTGAGGGAELARGFAVGIVLDGAGSLRTASGDALALARGAAVLVPWAAGDVRVEGEVVVLLCRPPATDGRSA